MKWPFASFFFKVAVDMAISVGMNTPEEEEEAGASTTAAAPRLSSTSPGAEVEEEEEALGIECG